VQADLKLAIFEAEIWGTHSGLNIEYAPFRLEVASAHMR
jgi:hypothetical protein